MKRLSIVVGMIGLLHISFYAWAPWIAKWQNTNLHRRLNAMEAIDVAMEVFYERMHTAFIVSAVLGLLMLVAAYLLYRSHPTGWKVWLMSLILGAAAAIHAVFQGGPNGGNLVRFLFLAVIAYATYRIKRKSELAISALHEATSKSSA